MCETMDAKLSNTCSVQHGNEWKYIWSHLVQSSLRTIPRPLQVLIPILRCKTDFLRLMSLDSLSYLGWSLRPAVIADTKERPGKPSDFAVVVVVVVASAAAASGSASSVAASAAAGSWLHLRHRPAVVPASSFAAGRTVAAAAAVAAG